MMDETSRQAFASKLVELRDNMPSHYPPDQDQFGYEHDLVEEKVKTFVDRLEQLFDRFELTEAKTRLAAMRKSFKGTEPVNTNETAGS